ncbi:unnamed protein product [Polarella glacialis]|uniref:SET domain-containing protein n=1 Tax=Polarella glacialis TaxID=89957 RepID=A0A813JSX6_POLGL|nr:unnamed protein product [Polarella glacialis]
MPGADQGSKARAFNRRLQYVKALASIMVESKIRATLKQQQVCDVTQDDKPAAAVSHILRLESQDGRGLGVFAAKDIERGEILFIEQPFAYVCNAELCMRGSLFQQQHDQEGMAAFQREHERTGNDLSPEVVAWSNAQAFYGATGTLGQDAWGTNLVSRASAHVQAPGYLWSQRRLRIFQKAMELEDSVRFIPLRITETHADASPMPDCHVNESEKPDADHIRLLPPKTNEAFVVGLQSEEGQKLNGDHGPITDHHVNKATGDYRCSVLFEETGVTKRIQRKHLKTFPGVVQTNAFQVDDVDGHDCHALFSLASRFNHSCVPNAGFLPLRTGSQKTHKKRDDQSSACDGHLVLVAIGKICVGEEITLDYLGPQDDKSGNSMQNVRNRRSRLARRYNFVCSCELCTLQDTNSTSPG